MERKPRVLILEDDKARHRIFRREIPYATICTTAADAIGKLSAEEWDVVFLDHDLGGEVFVESHREDTGMEVVRWLSANKKDICVVVHTCNPAGASEMLASLEQSMYDHRYMPFTVLYNRIEDVLHEMFEELIANRERS